jgi:hypothetical protein
MCHELAISILGFSVSKTSAAPEGDVTSTRLISNHMCSRPNIPCLTAPMRLAGVLSSLVMRPVNLSASQELRVEGYHRNSDASKLLHLCSNNKRRAILKISSHLQAFE